MSSSIGDEPPTFSRQASSTLTWQVAQAQAPPHSASIPGMLLRIAVSMTVEPSSASTVRPAPLESLKVIFGIWKDSRNDFVVDDARLYIVIRVGKPSPVIAGIASPRSRPAPHRRPARVDRLHRRSRLGRGPRPVRWRPQPARRDQHRYRPRILSGYAQA